MSRVVAAVAVLTPLALAPGLTVSFDITPKVVILLAGTALALPWRRSDWEALSALAACRVGRWQCGLLAAGALSLAVSTVFSADPALSVAGSSWRRFGLVTQTAVLLFALVAAAHLGRRLEQVRVLLRWMAAGGLFAALYGIAQYFGWDPLLPPEGYHVGEGERRIVRPPSTLGYVSYAATYYLHVVFAGLAVWQGEQRRGWKMLGCAAAVFSSAAMLLSGTRAALLGLMAGGAFLLWRERPRSWRVGVAVAAAVMVLFAAFYVSPAGEKLRARVLWATEEPLGGARRWLWVDSMRMGFERPWVGWGPETFQGEFPRFQSLELARAYPDFHHESPHNMFLDALIERGLPGLLTLAGLCGLGLWCARGPRLPAMLGASLVAAVVSQQFTVFIVPTALYFYLTVAALTAVSVPRGLGPRREGGRAPATAVAALLAGCLLWYAGRLAVSEAYLAETKRLLEEGGIREAAARYEQACRWQPPGASADLWYSRAMVSAAGNSGDLLIRIEAGQRAMEAARRAAGHSENRANALYNLGIFHAASSDFEGTVEALRGAIQAAPQWFKPHWTLAQTLALAGRWEEAEAEAARAAELNGGKNPEVAETLENIRRRRQPGPAGAGSRE